jgi:hypothetical protein
MQVRVAGRGCVRNGEKMADPGTSGRCDLCGGDGDAVVSVDAEGHGPFACKSCLRARLEAITVALWEFREPSPTGLPWGKATQ